MDPNVNPQPDLGDQSQLQVPVNPPVFHNPLAASHDAHTQQLPAVSSPTNEQMPMQTSPSATETPSIAQPVVNRPPTTPVSPPASAALPVSQLPDSPIRPAPVRLAPEPRADDAHAASAVASASVTPFGAQPATQSVPTTPQTPPGQAAAPKSHRKKIIGITAGIGIVLILAAAGAVVLTPKKAVKNQTQAPTLASSTRDTTERPLQPFAQKVSSDCYIFQVPIPSEVQTNKDCLLSVVYGEQKVSTITVSPQREFDVVAEDNSSNSTNTNQNQSVRFNTEKYLEALIANAIPKELILTRETVTVGKLNGTKVVGKKDANGQPVVAYVFVVLPEGDRKFNEKTFVAFVMTGAYNDDYSRKGFDQAIATWSWK